MFHFEIQSTYYMLPYLGYTYFIDNSPVYDWERFGHGAVQVPGRDDCVRSHSIVGFCCVGGGFGVGVGTAGSQG